MTWFTTFNREPVTASTQSFSVGRVLAEVPLGLLTQAAPDRAPRRHSSAGRTIDGLSVALLGGDIAVLAVQSTLGSRPWAYALLFASTVLICRASVHQYRSRMHLSVLDDMPRIAGSTLAAVGLTLCVASLGSASAPAAADVLQRAGWFIAAALLMQMGTFAVTRKLREDRRIGRRTLIVGSGRVAATVGAALADHPELGLTPVGYVHPNAQGGGQGWSAPVLTTDMAQLANTILEHEIDTTILAFDGAGDPHVDTIITIHRTGCTILVVPALSELHHDGPNIERVRGVPLLRVRPDPTLRPSWWIKRAIDIGAGAVGLLVLALPMAIVGGLILISSGGQVLFWQDRVGLDGQTFRLCKFRSLRPQSESESRTTWNIASDPRVGRLGRFLRRSSVDEIPQLWNIVRGQMSLVGPRPERPVFVQKFSQEHDRYWARHRVPVGLTGLAQVNGLRGDTSIGERARYDNYYIANWSLWLDLKIVMLTVREVLGGHGR
jgi:exopolysaccharide biosynthesis polyprenyl glycosylphosphotransferase